MRDYIKEIVFSFQQTSNKEFIFNFDQDPNSKRITKSIEIVYGLRNLLVMQTSLVRDKNIYKL